MVRRTFIVERPARSAWVPGRGAREQPLWDEHAEFMDALFATGVIFARRVAENGPVARSRSRGRRRGTAGGEVSG